MLNYLKLLILFACFNCIGCLLGCSNTNSTSNNISIGHKPIVQVIIYGPETYGFEVNKQGSLKTCFGTMINLDKTKGNFDIANLFNRNKGYEYNEKKKNLSSDEMNDISNLLIQITETKGFKIETYQTDSWEVYVFTGNNEYQFYYGTHNNDCYGKLIEKLIEYSPIKVNIRGLA